MVIEDRDLAVGTVLTATYKAQVHTCEVIQTGAGVRYRLTASGQLFGSPSAAGSAVMQGIACNGWRFWRRAGEEVRHTPADARLAPRTTVPGVTRQIRRLPNQRGVPEGSLKWFCSGCMASFVFDGSGEPEACPEGHPRDEAGEVS